MAQSISDFDQFTDTNKDYLAAKYLQTFAKEPYLSVPSVPRLVQYIYNILPLEKYNQNQQNNTKIQQALTQSVHKYINNHTQLVFSEEKSIQIMKFCLEDNQMFTVQYENKQNNQNAHQTDAGLSIIKQQNQTNQTNPQQQIDAHNIQLQEDSQSKEGITPQELPSNTNFVLVHKLSVDNSENQFNCEAIQDQHSPQLIRKNAKKVFSFYCKQQMQIGSNNTFQQISKEVQTMTLGKCLVFAKANSLFNSLITRQLLIRKFKRISEGLKCLDFDKFYIMLNQLQIIDPELFSKLNLHQQWCNPDFKYLKFAFDTKLQNPKQTLIRHQHLKKLTIHSGKSLQSLQAELKDRKNNQGNLIKLISKQTQKSTYESRLSPKDLKGAGNSKELPVNLSFIGNIINPQQNDDKWLKDYNCYLPGKNSKLSYNRMSQQLPKLQKNTHKINRKNSILLGIKERIKNIEATQNQVKQMKSPFSKNRYHV